MLYEPLSLSWMMQLRLSHSVCAVCEVRIRFTGLNFHSFHGSTAIHKSLYHENLDQSANTSVFARRLHHKIGGNGGNLLGQLDMQLRTSTEAIDYINMTSIQRKRQIDESKTKTLHP